MGRQAHSALCLSALKGEKRRNNGASCKEDILTPFIIADVIRLVKMFFEKIYNIWRKILSVITRCVKCRTTYDKNRACLICRSNGVRASGEFNTLFLWQGFYASPTMPLFRECRQKSLWWGASLYRR